MSISWRLRNASSIAFLVGDVMPFMFKVAMLIEAIRSTAEGVGEGLGSQQRRLYFVLVGL